MSLDNDPPTPIRPLAALKALTALRRNPQDTGQVFLLGEAIKGRTPIVLRERFLADPQGRQRLAERRSLLPTLGRTAWLASLPPGSFGRVYHDFLAEQNLSAQGLVDVSRESLGSTPDDGSDRYFIGQRLRDIHDLFHVLGGFGVVVGHQGAQLVDAIGVLGDVIIVLQTFIEDHVQHRVDQHAIGARRDRQVDVGELRQHGYPWIDNDQRETAFLQRLF